MSQKLKANSQKQHFDQRIIIVIFFTQHVTFLTYFRRTKERMNRSQYNKCVEQFADRIFRFALSSLRNEDLAKDVVQETFARIWEHVDTVEFERAKSYLFTAAHHIMIDEIRRCQKTEPLDESNVQECVGNSYNDLQEVLHNALSTLPEVQRNVILLRDYEGYSYQEIGKITGLSESQVKVYIFRGRTALKKQLKSIDNLIDVEP